MKYPWIFKFLVLFNVVFASTLWINSLYGRKIWHKAVTETKDGCDDRILHV